MGSQKVPFFRPLFRAKKTCSDLTLRDLKSSKGPLGGGVKTKFEYFDSKHDFFAKTENFQKKFFLTNSLGNP